MWIEGLKMLTYFVNFCLSKDKSISEFNIFWDKPWVSTSFTQSTYSWRIKPFDEKCVTTEFEFSNLIWTKGFQWSLPSYLEPYLALKQGGLPLLVS